MKKSFITVLIIVISTGLLLADTPVNYKSKPMTPQKNAGPHTEAPLSPIVKADPILTDDPIGEYFSFGTTWYDIQHNGTCGRQINVDPNGYVHIAWMNGLDNGASQRHIYYNLMDPSGSLMFGAGVQVDPAVKAGYTTSGILSDNRSVVAHHQGNPSTNYHTAISWDFIPYIGAFMTTEVPWYYQGGFDLEIIWPKISVDINDRIHIASTENPASGIAGALQRVFYGWAELDPATMIMNMSPEQEMVSWTMTISAEIASSPVSSRSALGFMQMCATDPLDTTQYDNDVIVVVSEDGLTWNWNDTINITNFIPPDLTLLPDTIAANKDTLRAYCDMNIVFDYNDVMHVFFSTFGFYSLEGTLAYGNGYIWHWDEVNQVYSMVANGWFDNAGSIDPGAWNVYAQRPSAAVDPVTGDIYCMYQRYIDPIGPAVGLPFPYLEGDITDISAAGWPNGEIWITKSTDGGVSWSEGINATDTNSPHAAAGNCRSEITPSAALQIYDEKLHFFYILDIDAGAVVQNEGVWTLNQAMYQRVPLDMIPAAPVLPPYPMHCDSTGMPGFVPPPLELDVTLTPVNPPIVVPANGGMFEFNIEIANNGTAPVNIDIWTMVTLPNGSEYGPIINVPNFNTPPGWSGDRDRDQAVPASASSGNYTYDAYVGNYPNQVYAEDHFAFSKSPVDNGGEVVIDWSTFGDTFDQFQDAVLNDVPEEYQFLRSYPNPFNPMTTLSFSIAQSGFVSLSIFDIQGREAAALVDEYRVKGLHEVTFDAAELSSGIYFARLQVGDFIGTQKLLLVK